MKKKSLLLFTPYYYPQNNAGVIRNEVFINEFKNHYNVTVLTGSKNSREKSLFIKNPSNKDRFIIRFIKEILAGFELFFRIIFSGYDLYYFSSPTYFTIFIGSLGCILLRKKYVLDIRDIYPEVFFNAGIISPNHFLSQICIKYTRFIYDHASLIATVTDGLVKKLQEQTSTEVLLIRNGYDPSRIISGNPRENFSCIFHGTLGLFQDIELLKSVIEATYLKDPQIEFHIIGDGPKASLVRSLESPNLTFHGPLSYEKIVGMISSFHLGLSFRLDNEITKDAFPVKVYEYIGAEIPCLSSPKDCEVAKFIDELNIGRNYSNLEVDKITNDIIEIKSSSEVYLKLKQNLSNKKSEFTRQEQAKKLALRAIKL